MCLVSRVVKTTRLHLEKMIFKENTGASCQALLSAKWIEIRQTKLSA